jgi:hypothetical protein
MCHIFLINSEHYNLPNNTSIEIFEVIFEFVQNLDYS